jgi:precorrin-6A synthase
MRKVFIIGIGAGNPDYITVQAINALNEVDVVFVMDKGREKEDLVRLRKEICKRYIKNKSYRTIVRVGRQSMARAEGRHIREIDRTGTRRGGTRRLPRVG